MRTEKAIKNTIVLVIYQVVSIICGLIAPRLVLSTYGSTYNGVIASANQFLDMASLLVLGISGSTKVALYKPLADGDGYVISSIMKATKQYMHRVGIAIVFYILGLSVIYPYISHNDLSGIECGTLIAITGISVFSQYFFGNANHTLLVADQSEFVYFFIMIASNIANTVSSVLLIKFGYSIYMVKMLNAIIFLFASLILEKITKKRYDLVDNCEPDTRAIKQRGAVAFHSIANIIHQSTDLVILTLFTDAKVISIYTVHYLVVGRIKSMFMMLTSGLEAAFGNLWVQKELKSFEHNFKFLEYLSYSFSSIIFSTVGVMLPSFVMLYTDGVTDIKYILPNIAILMAVTEAMQCIRQPYLVLVQATGNYDATKTGAIIEAVLNILVSFFLVKKIGLAGVIIGTLIANVFRTIQYAFFISNYIIKGSIRKTIRQFIYFCINSVFIVIFDIAITSYIEINVWSDWVFKGCICMVIALLVTSLMGYIFHREKIYYICEIVKNMVRRMDKKEL